MYLYTIFFGLVDSPPQIVEEVGEDTRRHNNKHTTKSNPTFFTVNICIYHFLLGRRAACRLFVYIEYEFLAEELVEEVSEFPSKTS